MTAPEPLDLDAIEAQIAKVSDRRYDLSTELRFQVLAACSPALVAECRALRTALAALADEFATQSSHDGGYDDCVACGLIYKARALAAAVPPSPPPERPD